MSPEEYREHSCMCRPEEVDIDVSPTHSSMATVTDFPMGNTVDCLGYDSLRYGVSKKNMDLL